jgi:hypothetical protein
MSRLARSERGRAQLWAKTLQFICSVPLCLGVPPRPATLCRHHMVRLRRRSAIMTRVFGPISGLKTKWFCAALGVVCLLEAWIQWSGLHW